MTGCLASSESRFFFFFFFYHAARIKIFKQYDRILNKESVFVSLRLCPFDGLIRSVIPMKSQ